MAANLIAMGLDLASSFEKMGDVILMSLSLLPTWLLPPLQWFDSKSLSVTLFVLNDMGEHAQWEQIHYKTW
jgi:hypothetical protein